MARKPPQTYRAVTLPPRQVVNLTTGEVLTKGQAQRLLLKDLRTMQELVQWQVDATDDTLMQALRGRSEPPNAAGLYLGLNLPASVMKTLFPKGASGASRFEKIWRGEVVTLLRSWQARRDAYQGTSTKYVSSGWKRTADPTRPRAGARLTLGYADAQYCYWETRTILRMVIGGVWHALEFVIPPRFDGRMPCLPILHLDRRGRVVFKVALEAPYQQGRISTRYVVGVDVGISKVASISVWDEQEGRIVYQSDLSRRVHSLQNSVKATQRQVGYLQEKVWQAIRAQDFITYAQTREEVRAQRASLGMKRRELAVLVGQEVAAVAASFGNAVVAVEDLSHIRNTMRFGRWNRGEVVKWLTHFVELNGSRVVRVNPAYTSQECGACGTPLVFRSYHAIYCPACKQVGDRDLNAAVGIARRAVPTVGKLVASRRKSRFYQDELPRQESVRPRVVLCYPGSRRRALRVAGKCVGAPAAVSVTASNVAGDGGHVACQDSKKATGGTLPLGPRKYHLRV